MEDVAALSSELEAAKVPYQIEVYSGAPHGFTNFEGERYQKRADERSWNAFTNFLTEVFGS
jgi:dienelactone hydrolase